MEFFSLGGLTTERLNIDLGNEKIIIRNYDSLLRSTGYDLRSGDWQSPSSTTSEASTSYTFDLAGPNGPFPLSLVEAKLQVRNDSRLGTPFDKLAKVLRKCHTLRFRLSASRGRNN